MEKTNLIALPLTPFLVTISNQQQQQQQLHDDHLNSLFSPVVPLSCLSLPTPPLAAPIPALYLARALPSPAGVDKSTSSKKQDTQAAPPLKRLRDAM